MFDADGWTLRRLFVIWSFLVSEPSRRSPSLNSRGLFSVFVFTAAVWFAGSKTAQFKHDCVSLFASSTGLFLRLTVGDHGNGS